jgi:hypothetical protein
MHPTKDKSCTIFLRLEKEAQGYSYKGRKVVSDAICISPIVT